MKKLMLMLFVAAIFGACSNNTKTTNDDSQKATVEECTSISVDSFLIVAADIVGKEVTVQGTVDHVCKHGGKRVKIFSSCPSKSLHGEAGETMGNFKAELEGSTVCLTGIVGEEKIDLAYVDEYEKKVRAAMEEKKEEADMEHKAGVDHHAGLEKIAKWKEEIEASEKGYLSNYYLEVAKYDECAKKDCAKKDAGCCKGKEQVEEVSAHDHEGHDHSAEAEPCSDEDKAACDSSKEGPKPCAHEH